MAQGPRGLNLVTIRITVWMQESEVRNPDSLDYRITNTFRWNFMDSWGVAYRPTGYILVTIRVTIRIRESVPDHDPDLGRTATTVLCWHLIQVRALSLSTSSCSCRSNCAIYYNCCVHGRSIQRTRHRIGKIKMQQSFLWRRWLLKLRLKRSVYVHAYGHIRVALASGHLLGVTFFVLIFNVTKNLC